jgi:type IV pilus assembly protein PilB
METLNQRIFKALLQFPNVGQEQIDQALAMQRQSGISLGEALIKNKVVNEKDLLVLLVKELHIPSIDLRKYRIDEKLKTVIPEAVARQYKIVPISQLGDTITVAFADPMNIFAIDDLKSITGRNIDVVMGIPDQRFHQQVLRRG